MAKMNFGGIEETVIERSEFPLEKAREILKDETIAVLGYGVQGPGQSLNLRDSGFKVIVGQREGKTYEKAVKDGWIPGETLFSIEEACKRGTIIMCLLSDAAVMSVWPVIKKHLTEGKALYFSHGFAIAWSDRTGVVPPKDVDVIMVAPKGSGTSLRTMFLEGRGVNASFAIEQDYTGHALERTLALGIGIGSGYLFETTFVREAVSDLTGERGSLMGAIQGLFLAQYEVLRENRSFQRNSGGTHAITHAAVCAQGYGLDVCQLLHYRTARRTGLDDTIPRCNKTGDARPLREREEWHGGTTVNRLQLQGRLPRDTQR